MDKNTVGNFTPHGFYNLSGNLGSEILGHVIYGNANRFLPINSGLIPTGQLAPVQNTPMDFQTPTPFGARIKKAPRSFSIHSPIQNRAHNLGAVHRRAIEMSGVIRSRGVRANIIRITLHPEEFSGAGHFA